MDGHYIVISYNAFVIEVNKSKVTNYRHQNKCNQTLNQYLNLNHYKLYYEKNC